MTPYGKTHNCFRRDPDSHKLIPGHPATEEIALLWDIEWEFTEKIDGTNIRLIWIPDEGVIVKGRSDKAELPKGMKDCFDATLEELFNEHFPDVPVCVYGEGYGAGIQKGGHYSETKRFAAFDIKIGHTWLPRVDFIEICQRLNLEMVPLITHGPLTKAVSLVRNGLKSKYGDFFAEGLVARPAMPLLDRRGHRILVKVKHKELYEARS
ncbi:MAG: hypothetical protein GY906_28320 [bacterium]|nr:hypothetical protein [bacterium]